MTDYVFRLGGHDDIECLSNLFCLASSDIGLKESVCAERQRAPLLKWFVEKCISSSLWTTDGRACMAVIDRNLFGVIDEIQYIVVHESHRRQGIGLAIVRHIQGLEGVTSLWAEARNFKSRSVLLHAGFVDKGEKSHNNYPILRWVPA
jgi:GNAT superfamily N-acetyltransferase